MSKTAKTKKDSIASSQKNVMSGNTLQASFRAKSSGFALSKDLCSTSQTKSGVEAFLAPCKDGAVPRRMGISPSNSFSGSASLDESMSTSDSLMSPEFEYISNLNISDSSKRAGSFIKG